MAHRYITIGLAVTGCFLVGCGESSDDNQPLIPESPLFKEARLAVQARMPQARKSPPYEQGANVFPDRKLVCGLGSIDTLPKEFPGYLYAYKRGVGAVFANFEPEKFCKLYAECREALGNRQKELVKIEELGAPCGSSSLE